MSDAGKTVGRAVAAAVDMMKRLAANLMLGISGKSRYDHGSRRGGHTPCRCDKKVYGLSRFSRPEAMAELENAGIEPLKCDLLDRKSVEALPLVPNVVFLAGKKFGTQGAEAQTWAMNVLAPSYAGEHFRGSRIVVFSTGCVYPLVGPETGGCNEAVVPEPLGEYSQSCLGRERIFEYCGQRFGTRTTLFRLNYSVDCAMVCWTTLLNGSWPGFRCRARSAIST